MQSAARAERRHGPWIRGACNRRGAGEGQIPAALLRSSAVIYARNVRVLALLFLAACGGRLDGPAAADAAAEANDTVPCGDAGACTASTDYCSEQSLGPGELTYACATLPKSCHACACAAPPKIGFICSCTSDGDQIIVSCNKT